MKGCPQNQMHHFSLLLRIIVTINITMLIYSFLLHYCLIFSPSVVHTTIILLKIWSVTTTEWIWKVILGNTCPMSHAKITLFSSWGYLALPKRTAAATFEQTRVFSSTLVSNQGNHTVERINYPLCKRWQAQDRNWLSNYVYQNQ